MQNQQLTRRNFILKLGVVSAILASPLMVTQLYAAPAGKLTGANLSGSPESLVISLLLSAPVKYKVFTLKSPDRVVIDLMQTTLEGNLKQGKHDRPPVASIRYATRAGGFLRVVLDVTHPVEVAANMAANSGQNTLSLTLTSQPGASDKSTSDTKPRNASQIKKAEPVEAAPVPVPQAQPDSRNHFIVAIDPGHGGRDPGALGKMGTREKDVVLGVARKLKARIDSAPGMRAVLTRSSDVYVPLRQRIDIARTNKADLFISVHADAHDRSGVHGSSVYILSDTGASSEAARLLAESENSYELRLGDVRLAGNSNKIASILLDLSQNATMDRSLELAKRTLKELAPVSNPLRSKVESAGFVVLKAPDIPSMLVETAFISNPAEEKRLRTDAYQQRLADAIFKGVSQYKQAFAPSRGLTYASSRGVNIGSSNQYVVRSGDSLSEIADRHGVSVTDIKRVNRLNSSTIQVGQRLKIPTST